MDSKYSTNDFLVLIPKNVNYTSLIENHPDCKKIKINIIRGILSYVIKKTAYKVEYFRKKEGLSFKKINSRDLIIRIHSKKVLTKLFGSNYKKALKILHRKILFKYPYEKDKSFGFALNDVTRYQKLRIEKMDTIPYSNVQLVNRIKKFDQKLPTKINQKFKPLLKFFNNKYLTIDVVQASKEIEDRLTNDYGRYIIDLQKILDIHNGIYRQSHNPDTDGRLHNNFNNLNKIYRKHLRYKNQKIVELDLSNSVPFILSSLLSNSIYLNLNDFVSPLLKDFLYMFNNSLKSVDNKEIELFHKLCLNKEIYSYFSVEYVFENLKCGMLDYYYDYIDEERTQIKFIDSFDAIKFTKQDFLAMLFSKNNSYIIFERIFSKKFPTIFNFISTLKSEFKHNCFSHFLFQIESEIMLNQIAKEFNKKMNGKAPIFTIHDCICTVVGMEDILYEFMNEKFNKIFKLPPKIKKAYW